MVVHGNRYTHAPSHQIYEVTFSAIDLKCFYNLSNHGAIMVYNVSV